VVRKSRGDRRSDRLNELNELKELKIHNLGWPIQGKSALNNKFEEGGRTFRHSDILILLFVLVNNIPKFALCRIQ
jgi:hypothetical protein